MASNTQQTRNIRAKKQASQGTKRKAAIRSKGSTRSYEELFGQKKDGSNSEA